MSKKEQAAPSHPPVGTLIDDNTLELVELLGVGGYGVVYRAVEAYSSCPRAYAVKCLSSGQSSTRRQLHIREITLHQIASAHPSVVTLHRVVEDHDYTFIIMDYAPDHDLFTQILHQCRYLGDDTLIKHVFLQLIDAVQYCHSLGIYHRDLKPENILCFDRGYRVAITDFGLATTEKASKEFRTGSVYHMSPECQAADSSITMYSPMHNDIWSLGIILLNLATGRNPWKSATPDDPTYQAYRRDPLQFLPSVLPISEELNNILVRTLDVDWTARLPLSKLREAVENVCTFYSENVVFEGSLAKCPWEAGLDLGNGTSRKPVINERPVPHVPEGVEPYCVVSMSAVASGFKSQASRMDEMLDESAWDGQHSEYEVDRHGVEFYEDEFHPRYEYSERSYSSDAASPATPSSFYGDDTRGCSFVNLDRYTVYDQKDHERRYRDGESSIFPSFAESSMEDADDNRFVSSVFLATPVMESKPFGHPPDAAYMDGFRTQKRYSSPNTSVYSVAETSDYFNVPERIPSHRHYRRSTEKSAADSPDILAWPQDIPRTGSRPIDIQSRRGSRNKSHKTKSHSIFNPMRFFPRSSGASWLNSKSSPLSTHPVTPSSARTRPVGPPSAPQMPWDDYCPSRPVENAKSQIRIVNRGAFGSQRRTGRDWFPDFFAST